jgi:hypothetical protein
VDSAGALLSFFLFRRLLNIETIIDAQEVAKVVQRGPMYPSPTIPQ